MLSAFSDAFSCATAGCLISAIFWDFHLLIVRMYHADYTRTIYTRAIRSPYVETVPKKTKGLIFEETIRNGGLP